MPKRLKIKVREGGGFRRVCNCAGDKVCESLVYRITAGMLLTNGMLLFNLVLLYACSAPYFMQGVFDVRLIVKDSSGRQIGCIDAVITL